MPLRRRLELPATRDLRRVVIRIEDRDYGRLQAQVPHAIVAVTFDVPAAGRAESEVTMEVDAGSDDLAERMVRRICAAHGVRVLAAKTGRPR